MFNEYECNFPHLNLTAYSSSIDKIQKKLSGRKPNWLIDLK
jgi:hypothetical protein